MWNLGLQDSEMLQDGFVIWVPSKGRRGFLRLDSPIIGFDGIWSSKGFGVKQPWVWILAPLCLEKDFIVVAICLQGNRAGGDHWLSMIKWLSRSHSWDSNPVFHVSPYNLFLLIARVKVVIATMIILEEPKSQYLQQASSPEHNICKNSFIAPCKLGRKISSSSC